MNDREIPVTTLAGLTSISDLLSELPLSDTLPSHSLQNKSLLFHPRVAVEANNLLSQRDDALAQQLIRVIEQTNSSHIDVKAEYAAGTSDTSANDSPHLLKIIHSFQPNVFNSTNSYNQKFVNPNASSSSSSSQFHNAQQQNFSLHQNQMQSNNFNNVPFDNFNNFDQSNNQFQMQPQQQYQSQTTTQSTPQQTIYAQPSQQSEFEVGGHLEPQQQFMGQSSVGINNGSTTNYQHSINDLLVQQTPTLQQNIFNNSTETHHTSQSSYNIAQLIDTTGTQNQTTHYYQNNLHQQQQIVSSASTSQLNSQAYSTIDQTQFQPSQNQNHFNNIIQDPLQIQQKLDSSQLPQTKNHYQFHNQSQQNQQQDASVNHQEQYNNNSMHLRSAKTSNGTPPQQQAKSTPRNNEYLEQQQQQRPSPAQGTVAPETNHIAKNDTTSSITKTQDAPPQMMESFDIEESGMTGMLSMKKVVVQVSKIKMNQDELDDFDHTNDLFNQMKADEKRSPVKRKIVQEIEEETFNKPKLRRLEKKLAPVVQKLSTEELMKTNTYIRFNSCMEKIFEQLEDSEVISMDDNENLECIPSSYLASISAEAAKLKARASIDAIPDEKLTLLISYAMRSILSAKNCAAGPDLADELIEDSLEKVLSAIEAALLICNIYTSKDTKFLQEDNIDMIIKFVQFQLRETIFPSYDPVYTIETKKKPEKSQNKKKQTNMQKGITQLYTKIVELAKIFVRLFNKFHFIDTIILTASSLGVEPFFVDNIETLQFVCLDLVTSIFQNEKYKHHRHNILNDILSSVDRLPNTKRNLRPYKLMNNGGNIQMMTALVLQLIQCSVLLPDELYEDDRVSRKKNSSENRTKIDCDSFVIEKYKTATSIGGNFIQTFLNKCKSRATETDFRPLFENFIHDLLTTVNKPEWPASELLLTLLGTLLVKYMADKSVDQSIRVVSLEYLGIVAARLRKDTVKARNRVKIMDELIECIKTEQEKDGEDSEDEKKFEIDPEEERTEFLQKILLDYLTLNSQEENPVWNHARHFDLTTWFHDIQRRKKEINEGAKGYASRKKQKKNSRKRYDDSDQSDEDSDVQEVREVDQELNREIFRILDERKKYLLSRIAPYKKTTRDVIDLKTYLDYDNANLIAQYLASKRRFSQSFDIYLKKIILVVREPVVAIRTRAMKCLGNIVEVDQSILARKDMQLGVAQKLLDTAISVREAAVDLVGKYILTDRTLVDQYYDMISPRILDTGVSVRKRVIKILRDICSEFPDHPKIPDICIKMLRRINDEENIQKLVMEVFLTMWFTPCHDNDKDAIRRKCEQIVDVELSSQEKAFHGLLKTVFEPKESKIEETKGKKEISPILIRACQQIVDGLVDSMMELEKTNSPRLIGCVTAVHSFAQIRPHLLVEHAMSLEPYLNIKCMTNEQAKFMGFLAEILEQVVPLMDHPGDIFLKELEAHLMMLIVTSRQSVIVSCVACLGSVINKLTKNYGLVRECFSKIYQRALVQTKTRLTEDPNTPPNQIHTPIFRRGIFTVGLLMRYFDFSRTEVNGSLSRENNRLRPNVCDDVFADLFFFLNCNMQLLQREILQALGHFCVTNAEYLTRQDLRDYYNYLLNRMCDQNDLKIVVLKNILMYLMEEENKMTRNDKDWQTQSKTEDLKEMGDISSGMSSRVIQIYLKEILNCFLNEDFNVRVMAMRVIEVVLRQGLVHPVQIVPYLICLSTDPDTEASHTADRHLQEIDKQYQGFVNMKCQLGIQLSYDLQKTIQQKTSGQVIRGYRMPKPGVDEPPTAANGYVYSLLRSTKPNRRALIQSMTKQFDDQKATLSFMLYLADNLAYFPYAVQDEPLYLIHQIDLFISVQGTNLLQTFRDGLKKREGDHDQSNPLEDEDDDEDPDAMIARLPDDTSDLQQCVTAAQGCMLLLILKQHLKEMYGINDAKISQYSPSESSKLFDKAIQRKNVSPFTPKATISILREERDMNCMLNETDKRLLVDRYLEFKQLMIRLDPDEEIDEDEQQANPGAPKNPQPKNNNQLPNTSQAVFNEVDANHVHLNNVQVNLTKVALPPDVEMANYEKTSAPISVNSNLKPSQKPAKVKSSVSSKKSSSNKRRHRRKISSTEDEESEGDEDDNY